MPLPRDLGRAVIDLAVNPVRNHDARALESAVSGRVVLVTGASYGLGEATARRLSGAGATVALLARSRDRLDDLADDLRARGGHATVHPADLTDPASLGVVAEKIMAEHGQVDVVVNNAGKSLRRSVDLQYDRLHDFTRTMDVNYTGPVALLLGLLPAMRARGAGHIVNISTIGVRMPPTPRWGAYQASKSAFDIWLRSIAPEIAPDGVTTSSIYMALMHTRMSAPTPVMRRLPGLDPEEAAGLVARAVIDREAEIAPWWTRPTQVPEVVGRSAYATAQRWLYGRSSDSPRARGVSDEVGP